MLHWKFPRSVNAGVATRFTQILIIMYRTYINQKAVLVDLRIMDPYAINKKYDGKNCGNLKNNLAQMYAKRDSKSFEDQEYEDERGFEYSLDV